MSKGIDEHSKIAITWAGWALGGDIPTGRVDPLMIDKDGKSIDLDPLAPANSKVGERPPIPERSPAAPLPLLLLSWHVYFQSLLLLASCMRVGVA